MVSNIVTSLSCASLSPEDPEGVVYACLGDALEMLIPLSSKEDVDTLSTLEMHLRQELRQSLVGRIHVAQHGRFVLVKATIDRDMCESFRLLSTRGRQSLPLSWIVRLHRSTRSSSR